MIKRTLNERIETNGKSKMKSSYERFLYLQRESQHQVIGGTEKSHGCRVATESNSPKANLT